MTSSTRNRKFARHRNYLQKHVPMGKPYCSCQKTHPWGLPTYNSDCELITEKNSLLPSVTPATGTKTGTFALMPLLKIDELFALLKGAKYFIALDLHSGYYHTKLDKELSPKCFHNSIQQVWIFETTLWIITRLKLLHPSYLWPFWTQQDLK